MTTEKTYISPVRQRREKMIKEIIESYEAIKKNKNNSVTEWRRQIASEYGISESTVSNYLKNKDK